MADKISNFDEVWIQAQRLPAFQKIRLMERLAESVQHELQTVEWREWHDFIDRTAGSLADDPIERLPQGSFETREPIE